MTTAVATFDHLAESNLKEPISEQSVQYLRTSRIEGNLLYLPKPGGKIMLRKDYEAVNEILERLGGMWKGGRVSAHVFGYDPTGMIDMVCAAGKMPQRNPTAFFPTPQALIDELLVEVDFDATYIYSDPEPYRILEPSAGQGAIVRTLLDRLNAATENETAAHAEITLVEMLALNAAHLGRTFAGELETGRCVLVQDDFVQWAYRQSKQPGAPMYDLVIMNPPFSVEGDATAYITHIEAAWKLVKPGGRLASITPQGWVWQYTGDLDRKNKRLVAFWELVAENQVSFYEIPQGAFSESGTQIATAAVVLNKSESRDWRQTREYNGWQNWHCWAAWVHALSSDAEIAKYFEREAIALVKRIRAGEFGSPVNLMGEITSALEPTVRKMFVPVLKSAFTTGDFIWLTECDLGTLVKAMINTYDNDNGGNE